MKDRGAWPASFDLDPGLVEAAVLLEIASRPPAQASRFRRQREPLYLIDDPDRRERAFLELHGSWFRELGLLDRLRAAIREGPAIGESVSRCVVLRAIRAGDEGADLHEDGSPMAAGRPALAVRLRPETLLEPDRLAALLRHELIHVADMLDPSFGYRREGGGEVVRPGYEGLVRQRYRVLWDITVDGRLAARGLPPVAPEAARLREFRETFPMLGGSAESWFRRLSVEPRPRHDELWRFACAPPDPVGTPACDLCGMPGSARPGSTGAIDETTAEAIRSDFPGWTGRGHTCGRCVELYESRATGAGPPAPAGPRA